MKFIISGKRTSQYPKDSRQPLRTNSVNWKRYFTPDTEVIVTLSVEKRKTENRGYHSGKRKYHPFRAGKQRYVRID